MDPSRLKVAELKIELKKRGLSLVGSKSDLVARLKDRLRAEERGEINLETAKQEPKKEGGAEVGGSVLAAVMTDDVPGKFESSGGGSKSTNVSKPAKLSRLAQALKRCPNEDDDDVMLIKSEEMDAAAMMDLVEKQTLKSHVYSGVVKSFSYKTGYGFIVPDGTRQDLFIHQSQISSDVSKSQTRGLQPGTEVEFLMSKNEFGKYIAVQVTQPGGKPLPHIPLKTKKDEKNKKEGEEDQERKRMEEQAAIVEGLAKNTAKAMSVITSWFKRDRHRRHKEPEKAMGELTAIERQLIQQKDKIFKGQCSWFNRGYGYVKIEGEVTDSEFFVHGNEIKGENGHKTLVPGQEIEFKLAIAEDNHLIAVNVTGPKGVPVPRQAIKMELSRKNEVDGGLFNKLHRGSILWFDFNKRYGFITPEGEKENYFVHASEIYTRNYRNLAGQNCEFRITQLRDGRLVAVRVTGQNGVILRQWKKKKPKPQVEEKKDKGTADVGKDESKEEIAASATAPVTAMSIKHASMLKKNKPSILSCEKCNKTFCTEFDQKAHYASNKHLGIKKAKRWGGNRRKDKGDGTIGPKKPGGNVLKLRCELCNVGFTGEAQEKMHLEGKKHAQKLREKENPRPKGYGFWRGKRRMGSSDAAAAKRRAAVQTAQTQAYQQAAAAAAVAAAVAYDPYGMSAGTQQTNYSTGAASSTYSQPTASSTYSNSKVPKQQTWYGNTQAQYATGGYSAYGTAANTTSPATTSSYSYPTQSTTHHSGQGTAHSGVYQNSVQSSSQNVQGQSQQIQTQQVQPQSQNYQASGSQRQAYDPYQQQQYNPSYPGHSY